MSTLEENDKIERALKLFPYFDTWNRKTVSDCCRLSKIRVIPPDNVIHGSDEGEPCGVHFIVEGTCRLIEHLSLVRTVRRDGRAKFSAFRGESTDGRSGAGGEPKYSSLLFNMGRDASHAKFPKETVDTEDEVKEDDTAEPSTPVEVTDMKISTDSGEPLPERTDQDECNEENKEDCKENDEEVKNSKKESSKEEEKEKPKDPTVVERAEPTEEKEENVETVEDPNEGDAEAPKPQPMTKFSRFYRRLLPYLTAMNKNVRRRSDSVETHFLQIALIQKGGCLGLGENLRNRFLVSVTEVTCMVIPLQFLLQHNPNNIWNRIKQFLNYYLPDEDKILSQFLINRKWDEDKARLVRSKRVKSSTKLSEVPKSIRLSDSRVRVYSLQ